MHLGQDEKGTRAQRQLRLRRARGDPSGGSKVKGWRELTHELMPSRPE